MFFFDFDNNTVNHIDNFFTDNFDLSEELANDARQRLVNETSSQGLRQTDLSILTGWGASKTSKITAGKQSVTLDDIRLWARVLGFTPEPFIVQDYNTREYILSSKVRSVSDTCEAFFDSCGDENLADAIIRYELPLSIASLLDIKMSDYIVRASSYRGILTNESRLYTKNESTYIKIVHRTTLSKNNINPVFSICFDPYNENFAISVYISSPDDVPVSRDVRKKYKDVLQIPYEETEDFDIFASKNSEWLSDRIINGEIASAIASTQEFPSKGVLENIIIDLYNKFCTLIWEICGVDIIPTSLKRRNESPMSTFDFLNIINGNGEFSLNVVDTVLADNKYSCEIDASHQTFISNKGVKYMEVTPLIPFREGLQYGSIIRSEANALCLCPNCKAKFLYGTVDDREEMIFALFKKHKSKLKEAGIDVTLQQVLSLNGL